MSPTVKGGATIRQLAIEVPGRIVKTYDEATDITSLVIDADQAKFLDETSTTLVEIFRALGQLPSSDQPVDMSKGLRAMGTEDKKGQNG